MVAMVGTYQDGYVTLDKKIKIGSPLRVVVTFLEDVETVSESKLSLSDFSFATSRKLSENMKGLLSDN